MKKNISTLEEVLNYKNDSLVLYFAKEYSLTTKESRKLFDDLKMWLWVCANRTDKAYPINIFNDLRVLDVYWHTFLLFTEDYLSFCNEYFGFIVYHKPEPHIESIKQLNKVKSGSKSFVTNNINLLKPSMIEVNNLLGPKILKRWYQDLPEKYGKQFAKKL